MKTELVIREANTGDCEILLELIKELADYEKLPDQVSATPDILRESLFGNSPPAHAVIAEYQQQAVGYALYFYNFSTFTGKPGIYLEDIYIKQEYRGRGYGKSLMSYVAGLAIAHNCARMEWSVLDWNAPAIEFYRSIGAEPMNNWTVQRLVGKALIKLADKR